MENNDILDQPEPRKRYSGKWMSLKFLGYGLLIFIISQAVLRGTAWLLFFYGTPSETLVEVLQVLSFFSGLAFVFCNLLGFITAIVHLGGGKDNSERIAGLLGLLANLLPLGLFLAL